MNEKPVFDQKPDSVDVLSPEFDRQAYAALLMERHEHAMRDTSEENTQTWKMEPEELDIYSTAFDPEAYIDDRIRQAKNEMKLSALIERLATLTPNDTPRARDLAITQGALTTINGRLAIPSMQEFEDMFSPNKVKILPTGSATSESGEVKLPTDADIKSAWKTNAAKMAAVLQMSIPTYENGNDRLQVYLPSLCRELSIDPRKYSTLRKNDTRNIKDQRFDAFTEWLAPVESYMLPLNGVYYRACIIESYDETSETVTLNPPFFLRWLEAITQKETRHAQLNRYFHADVANEKDEVAIAVAFYLAGNLLQRGETNPGKNGQINYRTTYASIISNVPQLKKALTDITEKTKTPSAKNTTTQTYNTKLKRTFETAYRLILEKSDFPQLYKELKINGVSQWEDPSTKGKDGTRRIASKRFGIPTKSRITDKLIITHRGRNEFYVKV